MAKFVIVGGDAAGMSAAMQLRRRLPGATIVVFEKGPYTSYSL
jgi:protoporphyrinogen oxidase